MSMDRYYAFRTAMNILCLEDVQIIDATMKNYAGHIEVEGQKEGQKIKVTVEIGEVNNV